jgi:hypothetical protein
MADNVPFVNPTKDCNAQAGGCQGPAPAPGTYRGPAGLPVMYTGPGLTYANGSDPGRVVSGAAPITTNAASSIPLQYDPTTEQLAQAQAMHPGHIDPNSPMVRLTKDIVAPQDAFYGLYTPGDPGRYNAAKQYFEGRGLQIGGGTTAAPGTTGTVHVDASGMAVSNPGANARADNPNIYAGTQSYSLISGSPASGFPGQDTSVPRAVMPFQPEGMVVLPGMGERGLPSYAIPTASLETNNPWNPKIVNTQANELMTQMVNKDLATRSDYVQTPGTMAQSIENQIAREAAYHKAGLSLNIPVSANPYEYGADQGLTILKGTKSADYRNLGNELQPQGIAELMPKSGAGLQDIGWRAGVGLAESAFYPAFAAFESSVARGDQGAYGNLYGGKNYQGTVVNRPLQESTLGLAQGWMDTVTRENTRAPAPNMQPANAPPVVGTTYSTATWGKNPTEFAFGGAQPTTETGLPAPFRSTSDPAMQGSSVSKVIYPTTQIGEPAFKPTNQTSSLPGSDIIDYIRSTAPKTNSENPFGSGKSDQIVLGKEYIEPVLSKGQEIITYVQNSPIKQALGFIPIGAVGYGAPIIDTSPFVAETLASNPIGWGIGAGVLAAYGLERSGTLGLTGPTQGTSVRTFGEDVGSYMYIKGYQFAGTLRNEYANLNTNINQAKDQVGQNIVGGVGLMSIGAGWVGNEAGNLPASTIEVPAIFTGPEIAPRQSAYKEIVAPAIYSEVTQTGRETSNPIAIRTPAANQNANDYASKLIEQNKRGFGTPFIDATGYQYPTSNPNPARNPVGNPFAPQIGNPLANSTGNPLGSNYGNPNANPNAYPNQFPTQYPVNYPNMDIWTPRTPEIKIPGAAFPSFGFGGGGGGGGGGNRRRGAFMETFSLGLDTTAGRPGRMPKAKSWVSPQKKTRTKSRRKK